MTELFIAGVLAPAGLVGDRMRVMKGQLWQNYEEVANFLLDKVAAELGLERVEGKHTHLVGDVGTSWEVDGKGVKFGDEGIVLIECKRYPTRKVDQATVGGYAFRLQNLGASGGILVSPLGIQEGGRRMADATEIIEVHLNPDCTHTEYVLSFLNRVFLGVSDSGKITDNATVKVVKTADETS